ncbi:hypothetical protein HN51_020501 [Arachis hypogaea]
MSEEFQSLSYVVALFSAMFWIYYALVKKDVALLHIIVNSFGIVVETAYLAIFLFFAPKKTMLELCYWQLCTYLREPSVLLSSDGFASFSTLVFSAFRYASLHHEESDKD